MKLVIDRMSVCMADDMEDHRIVCDVCPTDTLRELFMRLLAQRYFPSIAGNDVVWTLLRGKEWSAWRRVSRQEDLLSWKTSEARMYSRFAGREPTLQALAWKEDTAIFFDYDSPPGKRAQRIFRSFDGDRQQMAQQGFWEEYRSYHISAAQEAVWRSTLHG